MTAHRPRALTLSRRRFAFASLAALLLTPLVPAEAQEGEYSEAAVKAAFLFHFGTYVDWPAALVGDEALTIAVLGDSEIFEHLDQYLPGRTIDGRSVAARWIATIDEFEQDEILYIGRSENRRLDDVLETALSIGRGSLIVTDSPDGIHPDASANFRVVDSRVRFEINREAARRSGLDLSARLLAAAFRVVGDG